MNNKYYYQDGSVLDYCDYSKMLHREDGPAIKYATGCKEWWVDGKRHREDGPAVEYTDGSKEWWVDGKRHKEDGPAIEWSDGYKTWFVDGKKHRVNGPAVEYANGGKTWHINDDELTEEQFNNHIKVQHYRFQVLLEEVLGER